MTKYTKTETKRVYKDGQLISETTVTTESDTPPVEKKLIPDMSKVFGHMDNAFKEMDNLFKEMFK
jgi:hypothetical protein